MGETKGKYKMIAFRVTEEMYNIIKRAAELEGYGTVSDLVRHTLYKWLRERGYIRVESPKN